MRKTKIYNNDSSLGYGYILAKQERETASIHGICSQATSSITLVDTGDFILNSFLGECIDILNEKKVVVAGLVSKKTLASLNGRGVLTGFFRGTDESVPLGLLIIDKKEAWACFGEGHLHKITSGSEEIFQFANHLLWTKTDYEYSFGESRRVEQTMLSVVMPKPTSGLSAETESHEYATSGLAAERGLIVNEFGEYSQPSIVMPLDCRAYTQGNKLFVEILPDAFYEVDGMSELVIARSFDAGQLTPKDLVGKDIFYKGKKHQVADVESIEETVAVPVDEVATYEPDFDSIYAKKAKISEQTKIDVEVVPMIRDGSYQLSPNYKTHKQIEEQINGSLERLKTLKLEKSIEKKINSVETERIFEEKVRKYNDLVSNLDFGIEALKNKRNSFPTINQSKDSFVVPHELLGTLLVKGKAVYLAISDEGKVKDAKAWLKESGIEGTLILDEK